jgi:hypothetical protein
MALLLFAIMMRCVDERSGRREWTATARLTHPYMQDVRRRWPSTVVARVSD